MALRRLLAVQPEELQQPSDGQAAGAIMLTTTIAGLFSIESHAHPCSAPFLCHEIQQHSLQPPRSSVVNHQCTFISAEFQSGSRCSTVNVAVKYGSVPVARTLVEHGARFTTRHLVR